MGGFVLYEDDISLRVLTFGDLKKLIVEGKVDAPRIQEDEINDKSKGDSLTKLFVVIQTTWFVFQCITRWAKHLLVTELEVVTLAFAVLNVITYGLWWKKPQGVLIAIRVQLKDNVDRARDTFEESRDDEELLGSVGQMESFIAHKVKDMVNYGWVGRLFRVPLQLVGVILRPLVKMAADSNVGKVDPQSLRVAMFYADSTDDKDEFPMAVIGILFGCLHLIPWSSSFPSAREHWLWRFSTIVIIAEPAVIYLYTLAFNANKRFDDYLSESLAILAVIPALLAAPLYILARLALLIIAFTTLPQLPPEAYITIEWTTFVPHI